MEVFFIVLFIIIVIYSLRDEYLKKKNKEQKNYTDNFSMDSREYYKKLRENVITKELKVDKLIDTEIVEDSKKKSDSTINNYYTQNVYVNVKGKNNQKSKLEQHTEKVWKDLGYCVREGEIYSSSFYGKKLFTSEQVEKIVPYKVKYSEIGLSRKLLNDTGSKSLTKKILVDKYGLSESKADKLIKEKNKSNKYDYDSYNESSMSEWVQQAKLTKGWD